MRLKKFYTLVLAVFLSATISACFLDKKESSVDSIPGDIIIANTDYSTGSLSGLDSSTMKITNGILQATVDSDLYIRSYNGMIYVLNNVNNNLMLINPDDLSSITQKAISISGSYPHDILVTGSKAYVTLYGSNNLLIVNATTLEQTGTIDLSSYAPSGTGGVPTMDKLWLDSSGRYLYVSLQKFYSSYSAIDKSSIVVIDTSTNTVNTSFDLYAKNPYSKFVYATSSDFNYFNDGHDHLLILCAGLYNALDGGIVAIDLSDNTCETKLIVSESELNRDISDFDYANGKFYVATTIGLTTGTSNIYSITATPTGNTTNSIFEISIPYAVPFVKNNGSGLIIAGDRSSSAPGVWIFDTLTDLKKNSSVIPTGITPFDIAIIE